MNASPAVTELFEALRQAHPGSVPEQVAPSIGIPVASMLRHVDSSEHAKQHPYDSLRAALALRRNGTLRKLARELGFENKDAGALSDLLHGRYDHVSLLTANRWALALGLPLIPSTKSVQVCPSCLERGIADVHIAGDCMGRPIAAVVILAPGERVTDAPDVSRETLPAPQPRKRATVGIGGIRPATRAKLDARRRAHGWTWDEYLDIIGSLEEAFDE